MALAGGSSLSPSLKDCFGTLECSRPVSEWVLAFGPIRPNGPAANFTHRTGSSRGPGNRHRAPLPGGLPLLSGVAIYREEQDGHSCPSWTTDRNVRPAFRFLW